MTYAEAIDFLYGLRQFGTKLGLEHVQRLADLAGSPQRGLSFIHVAGTNGKGSVCAMLEAIYRSHGLRTGLFTSPHLVAFGERIQVNRIPLSEAGVIRLVERLQPLLAAFAEGDHPTFFEVVTLMALIHFAEASCDVVLWETGMGGRLDATNLVTPLATVITNIDMDHQRWLGNDLASIAREKAGIIKPGVPVVTGVEQSEARAVIEATARSVAAPLRRVTDPLDPSRVHGGALGLAGSHQWQNAALATAAVELLRSRWPVSSATVAKGLAEVSWPGRLQRVDLEDGRQLLLDGAHNAGGFRVLGDFLALDPAWSRPAWLVGFLEDKDRRRLWDRLRTRCSRLALVPVRSVRSAQPEEVAREARAALPGVAVSVHASLPEAWRELREERRIVVAGSIYLIGEVMSFLGLTTHASELALNEWGPVKSG